MSLISLKNVCKSYRIGEESVDILRDVTCQIEEGELVALVGASGSGKSTLMNILGCLDRPSSGEYWLDGEEVGRFSNDQRAAIRSTKIGFVFQSFNLLSRTTALENVMLPLLYTSIGEREGERRARELLAAVGLGDRMLHIPSQLSGGQQQRVAIARGLINSPRILFADEPTGNLDSKTSKEILSMFKDLNKNHGLTILIVTHDQAVASWADRAIEIRDGAVLK